MDARPTLAALLILPALAAPSRAARAADLVPARRGGRQEDHAAVRDPVWILETSGIKAAEAVGELARVLPDLAAPAAVEAEYMLGRVGPRAASAVPALTERLASSPDLDVRYEAVRALGRIGPAARAAVGTIAAAAAEPNADLRAAAAEALGRIEPRGAISRAALKRLSSDPDAGVRAACAKAFRPAGEPAGR